MKFKKCHNQLIVYIIMSFTNVSYLKFFLGNCIKKIAAFNKLFDIRTKKLNQLSINPISPGDLSKAS